MINVSFAAQLLEISTIRFNSSFIQGFNWLQNLVMILFETFSLIRNGLEKAIPTRFIKYMEII